MEVTLEYKSTAYQLHRYPKTTDKALRAWSNAEVLILEYIESKDYQNVHIFNDRFGIFNCVLHHKNRITIHTYASQQKAVVQNLKANKLPTTVNWVSPLAPLKSVELAVIKMPKSLELFELFLQQIHKAATIHTEVVCGFMTKYFSPSLLNIAAGYFDEVIQTKAWKKARLLVLKKPKPLGSYKTLINTLSYKNETLQQYYGVFSSGGVDIGTRFLLEHLTVKPEELEVLDVASGNGVIAFNVNQQNPKARLTLIDDFNLAIASSQLNLKDAQANYVYNDTLETLPKAAFDLVVSNPPFHFEHENNIDVALQLFKGVAKCLKIGGRFVLVANKHLNYKTHLIKLFTDVKTLESNKKFVIYECVNE